MVIHRSTFLRGMSSQHESGEEPEYLFSRCQVHRAEVAKLDLLQRRVEFDSVEGLGLPPIEARHVVLALGSRTNLRSVPGMMEHGLFLKTLADALGIHEHIMKRMEEASLEWNPESGQSLLHFVVMGGG